MLLGSSTSCSPMLAIGPATSRWAPANDWGDKSETKTMPTHPILIEYAGAADGQELSLQLPIYAYPEGRTVNFLLEGDAAGYLDAEGVGFKSPPKVSDLQVEPDKSYLIELNLPRVEGSVILFLLAYDKSTRLFDVSVPLQQGPQNRIFLPADQKFEKVRIAFRVKGSGSFLLEKMLVRETTRAESETILFQEFEAATASGSPVRLFYLQALDRVPIDRFPPSSILPYLRMKMIDKDFGRARDIVRITSTQAHLDAIAAESSFVRMCRELEIETLEAELAALGPHIKAKGITKYRVKLVNSGFGDVLTMANMAAYLSECLGLHFTGVSGTAGLRNRVYYQELLGRLDIRTSESDDGDSGVHVVSINDIAAEVSDLTTKLTSLPPGQSDTLCFELTNPGAMSALKDSASFCRNWLDNGFHEYFQATTSGVATRESKSDVCEVVIHVRLGDVAAVPIGDHVVIPYEVARGRFDAGIGRIGSEDWSSVLKREFNLVGDLRLLLSGLRALDFRVHIVLVSDGYKRTGERLSALGDLLGQHGVTYSAEEVRSTLDRLTDELFALDCDEFVVGEESASDFLRAVRRIVHADVLLSSSRAFIFNILVGFKGATGVAQTFISPVTGGYFEAIRTKNVDLIPFTSIVGSVEPLTQAIIASARSKLLLDTVVDFSQDVNVSPYARYFTSSVSPWEKHKSGHPLDGSRTTSRFSFHTDAEETPFLVVDLGDALPVVGFSLYMRQEYAEKSLPIRVLISEHGDDWIEVCVVDEFVAEVARRLDWRKFGLVRFLKIERIGFGFLFFSAVNVFCGKSEFLNWMRRDEAQRFVLVHAPFYGLGGRLAVLATAFGFLQRSHIKRILVHWGNSAERRQLAYPFAVDYGAVHKPAISRSLSSTLLSHIYGKPVKRQAEKRISDWRPPDPDGQERDVVFVSRDSIQSYVNRHEDHYACVQRLYRNILPSQEVLSLVEEIERKHSLEEAFSRALGIHVRHGNGERYFSSTMEKWGVKPPTRSAIINAIEQALSSAVDAIETIVLSSDCPAVADLLSGHFSDRVRVVFISDYIQDIGAGCNHLPHRFDRERPRKEVDGAFDELITFAEIMTLARCHSLCGGRSFFFDAAIGFSQCPSHSIFRIDNADRYTTVRDGYAPVTELPNDERAVAVVAKLKSAGTAVDGIFLDAGSDAAQVEMTYFDDDLFSGSLGGFSESVEDGTLSRRLVELRLY